jgi:glycosyltransferase involved in cell wall biosynthesis
VKIVHATLRFDSPGGVETTVREVARRQKAAGDDVEVFASDLVDEAQWVRGRDFRSVVDGVPVRRFAVRKQILPRLTLPTMVGLIDALADSGADVIHAHSHRYGHLLEAAAVARRCRIPLVVSTHYHPPDPGEPRWKEALLRAEDVGFGLTAYRIARALVVESAREAALVGAFAPRDRVRIVPPGVDLGEWKDPDGDATARPPLPAEYLLFAGRIASNKGLPVLLEALSRIPAEDRIPLVLMGPPWGENDALARRAKELGVADRVVWLGQVAERRTYRATLRGARALVLPSAWEAFGLVLLDAMAADVPIVATSVGAVPEVLEEGQAGRLVPYGDANALASALRAVRSDPEATARAVEAGRRRVRALDWVTSVERLRAVYREAMAGPA